MKHRINHKHRTGVTVSMTILAATLFLGFLMAALFKLAASAGTLNEDGLANTQARFAALSAINRAFFELEKNPSWRAGWSTEQPMPQNPTVRYKLKVLDQVTQTQLGGSGAGTLANGTDEVYLFAQGFTDRGAGRALAAAGGTAYRPGAQFSEACFADSQLVLSNTKTDGFDSRVGDHWYNPGETDPEKQTLVALAGDIGGNRDVRLQSAEVDGDLVLPQPEAFTLRNNEYTGPGDLDISGSKIHGKEVKPKSPREVAEVDPPFEDADATKYVDDSNFDSLDISTEPPPEDEPYGRILKPGAYAAVTLTDGKVLTLKPGTYYFRDSFELQGSTLRIEGNGPVKVFIGKQMLVSQSRINPSQVDPDNKNKKPANLQLLFADKGIDPDTNDPASFLTVTESSMNAIALGSVLQAEIDATEYFGALQGSRITAQNSQFHFDRALESLSISDFSKWKLRGLTVLPPETAL